MLMDYKYACSQLTVFISALPILPWHKIRFGTNLKTSAWEQNHNKAFFFFFFLLYTVITFMVIWAINTCYDGC